MYRPDTLWVTVTSPALTGVVTRSVRGDEATTMTRMIRNDTNWYDTDDNYISAHAGGITRVCDTYYWYGDDMENNPGGMFN